MPTAENNDVHELGPNRLVPLLAFIEGHNLDPLDYLRLVILGDNAVPSPIVVGDRLYVGRGNAAKWHSGVIARAYLRHAAIATRARDWRHEK